MTRKVAGTTKPSIEITDSGDSVTIKTVSALKTTEVTYPIGKEIDEETADGRKCKVCHPFETPVCSMLGANGLLYGF